VINLDLSYNSIKFATMKHIIILLFLCFNLSAQTPVKIDVIVGVQVVNPYSAGFYKSSPAGTVLLLYPRKRFTVQFQNIVTFKGEWLFRIGVDYKLFTLKIEK